MRIDDCCGQTPHEPGCVIIAHLKEEKKEEECNLCCDYCGFEADIFYAREAHDLVGCESCVYEISQEELFDGLAEGGWA